MISIWELIDPHIWDSIPKDHQINLYHLHRVLNLLGAKSGKIFIINDAQNKARGYRSKQVHLSLYERINAKRKKDGLMMVNPPMGSMHLIGAAADVLDLDGSIKRWVLDNLDFCEWLGVWFEADTEGWLHCQSVPPKSGKRFFIA